MIYHGSTSLDGGDFDGLEAAVRRTTKDLRAVADRFDAIIVQGTSGMCVGFPVALRLKVPIMVLRKPDDDSHGRYCELINGKVLQECASRVLFLDDFVSSGDTRSRCRAAVEKAGGLYVGQYTYREYELRLRTYSDLKKDKVKMEIKVYDVAGDPVEPKALYSSLAQMEARLAASTLQDSVDWSTDNIKITLRTDDQITDELEAIWRQNPGGFLRPEALDF